jgi:ATP-dependent helicase HrpA
VERAAAELALDGRGITGDTLVFLPGERQIQEALELLRREGTDGRELLPLYSRLSTAEQERISRAAHGAAGHPGHQRRGNLAHHPGRTLRDRLGARPHQSLQPRAKLQRLPIEPGIARKR